MNKMIHAVPAGGSGAVVPPTVTTLSINVSDSVAVRDSVGLHRQWQRPRLPISRDEVAWFGGMTMMLSSAPSVTEHPTRYLYGAAVATVLFWACRR